MNVFVHGVYDADTLKTLKDLGIKKFAFDLRGKSSNLIPFRHLTELLKNSTNEKTYLVFEDDKKSTVLSFLNLLKDVPSQFVLEFRDAKTPEYYQSINHPFIWMFNPVGDWQNIFKLPQLEAVILPIKWQSYYQTTPELWNIIEKRNLEVYLHTDSFKEAEAFLNQEQVNLSIDLSQEIESRFRTVDQNQLKNMKIWSKRNESFAIK